MGREQTGRRQRLLFYLACGLSAFLTFIGCSTIGNNHEKNQAYQHLERAQQLAKDGKCPQAISEQEKALALAFDRPPGDQVLYEMGLLLTDPRNQKRDINEALKVFTQLILDFPQSSYRSEAETWAFVLSAQIELGSRIANNEIEINLLRDKLRKKDQIIHTLTEQRKKMKQIDLELNKKREPITPGEE